MCSTLADFVPYSSARRVLYLTVPAVSCQSCGLLDKKSLEVPGVRDFAWSPSDTVISYWVPEVNYGETPARVTLLKIPRSVAPGTPPPAPALSYKQILSTSIKRTLASSSVLSDALTVTVSAGPLGLLRHPSSHVSCPPSHVSCPPSHVSCPPVCVHLT